MHPEWADHYKTINSTARHRGQDLWARAEAIRQELGIPSMYRKTWPAGGTPPTQPPTNAVTQTPPAQTNAGTQPPPETPTNIAVVDFYRK